MYSRPIHIAWFSGRTYEIYFSCYCIRMDFRMMFDVKIQFHTVNISFHISMGISLVLNLTQRFLFVKTTGHWKNLQKIKKKKCLYWKSHLQFSCSQAYCLLVNKHSNNSKHVNYKYPFASFNHTSRADFRSLVFIFSSPDESLFTLQSWG